MTTVKLFFWLALAQCWGLFLKICKYIVSKTNFKQLAWTNNVTNFLTKKIGSYL